MKGFARVVDRSRQLVASAWRSQILGRPVWEVVESAGGAGTSTPYSELLAGVGGPALVQASVPMRQVGQSEIAIQAGFYPVASNLVILCHRTRFKGPSAVVGMRLRRAGVADLAQLKNRLLLDDSLLADPFLASSVDRGRLVEMTFRDAYRDKREVLILEDASDGELAAACLVRGPATQPSIITAFRSLDELPLWGTLHALVAGKLFDEGAETIRTRLATVRYAPLNLAFSLGFLIRECRMEYHWLSDGRSSARGSA